MIIDLPLEQLKAYQGINPCPSDIDAHWDAALSAMKAMEPDVEIRQAAFTTSIAECFDLYFTGVGGARLHAKYLRPKNDAGPHPGLLQFHGYSGDSGGWLGKLGYVAAGFSVMALDCRGQGGKSQDVGGVRGSTWQGHIMRGIDDDVDKLYYHNVFLDCAQLASILMDMPEVDERRVGATGISQGGGLTLACASLEPRISRAAPILPFHSDYRRIWEMSLNTIAYEEIQRWFRDFDPLHERENEIFTKLGYIDVQHIIKRMRASVMMFTSLGDNVCPPSIQFAAYNKIQSPKEMIIYPDFGHESLPDSDDRIFQFMLGL